MVKPDISPLCGFPNRKITLYGVEKNFLDAIYQDYYMPTEFDSNIDLPELVGGQLDAVAGLYSTKNNVIYEGNIDRYGVISDVNYMD